MRTLADFLRITPDLVAEDTERLHLLVEDWQMLADLAFSDLVLWVAHEGGWVAAAHTRPMTGPMVFVEEVVGQETSAVFGDLVADAAAVGQSEHIRERGQDLLHERARPVRRAGRTIGVLSIHDMLDSGRPHTRLEESYASMGDDLFLMVAEGGWPTPSSPSGARRGAPRVGDGVMRLSRSGTVEYASPNALSAIRQLGAPGAIEGESLVQILSDLPGQAGHVDEGLALVAMGRAAWRADITVQGGAALALRAVPLVRGRERHGAIVLARDVSELRRRGTELMTKDQTIREIHHRVKNNLQTVAALLRMQSRRVDDESATIALNEAVRRVGVIALVYEALSTGFAESLDFDDVAVRGLRAVVEVARTKGAIDSSFTGSFGMLRAEDATALGLILSELVQNAVEHGVPDGGSVHVDAQRVAEGDVDILRVTVVDDGAGLPTGFRPSRAGLGTRIVTSMVQDLGGQIRWDDAEPRGTRVRFSARVKPLEE